LALTLTEHNLSETVWPETAKGQWEMLIAMEVTALPSWILNTIVWARYDGWVKLMKSFGSDGEQLVNFVESALPQQIVAALKKTPEVHHRAVVSSRRVWINQVVELEKQIDALRAATLRYMSHFRYEYTQGHPDEVPPPAGILLPFRMVVGRFAHTTPLDLNRERSVAGTSIAA